MVTRTQPGLPPSLHLLFNFVCSFHWSARPSPCLFPISGSSETPICGARACGHRSTGIMWNSLIIVSRRCVMVTSQSGPFQKLGSQKNMALTVNSFYRSQINMLPTRYFTMASFGGWRKTQPMVRSGEKLLLITVDSTLACD